MPKKPVLLPPGTEGAQPGPALSALYDLYRAELLVYARRRVGRGPPEPEDLVQQAFTNYAGLAEPELVRNPRAFLYHALRRLIGDYNKSPRRRHDPRPSDPDQGYLPEIADIISPEIILLDRERFATVVSAIRDLPRRQRRFLLLHRLQGLTYAEIARRNLVSERTVKREVEAAICACLRAVTLMGGGHE